MIRFDNFVDNDKREQYTRMGYGYGHNSGHKPRKCSRNGLSVVCVQQFVPQCSLCHSAVCAQCSCHEPRTQSLVLSAALTARICSCTLACVTYVQDIHKVHGLCNLTNICDNRSCLGATVLNLRLRARHGRKTECY